MRHYKFHQTLDRLERLDSMPHSSRHHLVGKLLTKFEVFEGYGCMPQRTSHVHTQQSALNIGITCGDSTNDYPGVFFHVCTDPVDQIFFARPSQPLLQTSQDDRMCCNYGQVLRLGYVSVDRLIVEISDIKIEIEFDDLGIWKQGVPNAMDSAYASLLVQRLVLQNKY
ncbi:uncharacterized protein ATC70_007708 [Mucor velutinosus]|uniref:Uncharacterized protein n=1 Tax=Mucor velutinosus TaxID=708070 RepID=A0AAN7D2G2_9FUNG|nr:hypothetical protein ATC70_007708 [Mucor velutinosus]